MHRKHVLVISDICNIVEHFSDSRLHDDLLFVAILTTSFHTLLHLGEMTFPNDTSIRDQRKVVKCSSLVFHPLCYEFVLLAHKADKTFEGNRVVVYAFNASFDLCPSFSCYLLSHNHLFPALKRNCSYSLLFYVLISFVFP